LGKYKRIYSQDDIEQLESELDASREQNALLRDKIKKLESIMEKYKKEVERLNNLRYK